MQGRDSDLEEDGPGTFCGLPFILKGYFYLISSSGTSIES